MATAKEDDKQDILEVVADSDDINCSICMQELKSPRTLPCMHTFCQHCLSNYIVSLNLEEEKRTHFPCRVCRQEAKPPYPEKSTTEWAAMFKQSHILISMLSQRKSKVESQCNVCKLEGRSEPITHFCLTCKEGFCGQCTAYHRSFNAMKDHTLVSTEEMMKNTQEVIEIADTFQCAGHEGEEIKYYCEDHEAECCVRCLRQKHRTCSKVRDLKAEAAEMLAARSHEHCIDEMKTVETHLHKIALADQINVSKIHSQGHELKQQIHSLRVHINSILDTLEQSVLMVYNEEATKKTYSSHKCLSMAAAIRGSYKMLEMVSLHGSDTQHILALMRSEGQLKNYTEQVDSKFEEVESIDLSLELHPYLKGLFSLNADDAARVNIVKTKEAIPFKEILRKKRLKPLKECHIEETGEVPAKCPSGGKVPCYSGAVFLPADNLILVDRNNHRCCLYDSNFRHITHYIFQLTENSRLWDVSMVNDKEVVVSMPDQNKLMFLGVEKEIRPTRTITIRYPCYGIATLSKDRIIVSGGTDTGKYYWSIVSTYGEELSYHEMVGKGGQETYLAVNQLKNRIYMSCFYIDALFCFDLEGKPVFTYKTNGLLGPRGVGLDADGNVYLVSINSSVHQLSHDGAVLKVYKSATSKNPWKICFSHSMDQFFVTNVEHEKSVCLYELS
ncbi:hypothetical protein CHS0354_022057 [Potamilus streckersoni]|uniref:Uncharacterized protein n=1 Tax=Potamilus streckersoni TaxID=2493646 RepID=A0AAE0SS72_9BIVA|nr:hypothetical protein CHS0354_022057 [Potamilus streckersoni]